ncbi:MAG: cyclic pyranopterin monophosphate synthase MoaC [Chloroflexi bacterium]|nr:cyclic pyranopterin monophosphate synthase MoaC [Chloroflexota bacterium]MCY3939418.1 cyclic pyranopterin monophosphate synthase MoaC [Chloroflexota bacterium]
MTLTHLDDAGRPRMVDVSAKQPSVREATASGEVRVKPETLEMITAQNQGGPTALKKGDVLSVAQIAGISAAKRTWDLIPLCHQLPLESVAVNLSPDRNESRVEITARVKTLARTGVEMEALTAVSVAALTLYDMCKAVDKSMRIGDIRLIRKTGGSSGDFVADE